MNKNTKLSNIEIANQNRLSSLNRNIFKNVATPTMQFIN
jgi:hypothetical protein